MRQISEARCDYPLYWRAKPHHYILWYFKALVKPMYIDVYWCALPRIGAHSGKLCHAEPRLERDFNGWEIAS